MAQSKDFVESISTVIPQNFPDLVRHASLPTEGEKCLSDLTCKKDNICTKPANCFREGKYRQINASKLCFAFLRWHS